MDDMQAAPVIQPSQGTHLVLPRSFLPGEAALMIPRTADGRVLFAIPWHGRVLAGTTDEAVPVAAIEPRALPRERDFLLDHLERYLGRPKPEEILSIWSGQRPLVERTGVANTAELSRDHTILISSANLVTVTGGKWTTYRKMAEDTVTRAAPLGHLANAPSRTAELRLHGWTAGGEQADNWEQVYGADLPAVRELAKGDPELDQLLHPRLPFRRCEVVWAARYEMARRVEDVLARRTRALFLDARASMEAGGITARLMARELGRSQEWEREEAAAFRSLAKDYVWSEG
jgi:glycerol-3-phosphate dehydrogenase